MRSKPEKKDANDMIYVLVVWQYGASYGVVILIDNFRYFFFFSLNVFVKNKEFYYNSIFHRKLIGYNLSTSSCILY
jgi:hypothetical protein